MYCTFLDVGEFYGREVKMNSDGHCTHREEGGRMEEEEEVKGY